LRSHFVIVGIVVRVRDAEVIVHSIRQPSQRGTANVARATVIPGDAQQQRPRRRRVGRDEFEQRVGRHTPCAVRGDLSDKRAMIAWICRSTRSLPRVTAAARSVYPAKTLSGFASP
jgi:hypothetical protein